MRRTAAVEGEVGEVRRGAVEEGEVGEGVSGWENNGINIRGWKGK